MDRFNRYQNFLKFVERIGKENSFSHVLFPSDAFIVYLLIG